MYIDFAELDFEKLKSEHQRDEYYSKVIDFLESYLFSDSFISYTSGSTGEPKALTIEKLSAEESARLSNLYFNISNQTQFLLCLDIRFIGSKLMLVRANLAKAKVTILKPSLKFYTSILDQKFDFISLTPLHVKNILEHNPFYFQKIATCLIGSSGVSFELENQLKNLDSQTKFYESFAMTETISHFALRNISSNETEFTVLSGFEISINEENCLEIYHPIILPKKISTNDIVEITSHTTLKYIGRRDNVINSSGLKIYPEILENEWGQYFDFKFIIAGEPEYTLGQQLIMIISSPFVSKELIYKKLEDVKIPHRYLPKEIYYCNPWHETESLKPKRKEIFANRNSTPIV